MQKQLAMLFGTEFPLGIAIAFPEGLDVIEMEVAFPQDAWITAVDLAGCYRAGKVRFCLHLRG